MTEALQNTKSQPQKAIFHGFFALNCNLIHGQIQEYVFHNQAVLSKLEWPLKPVIAYSGQANAIIFNTLHIEASATLLQPMQSGIMIDKDFFNITAAQPSTNLTHYSAHNCVLKDGSCIVVKAGIKKSLPQTTAMEKHGISISLEPMLGLYYSNIAWDATDGYYQYGKKDPNDFYASWSTGKLTPIHGLVASYRQAIIIPTVGLGFGIHFPYGIHLYSDLHASPQVISKNKDIHHKRRDANNQKLVFVDKTARGWAVYSNTQLLWQFFHCFGLIAGFEYKKAVSTDGITLEYHGVEANKPASKSSKGASGTGLETISFSLGFAFLFGV